MSLFACVSIDDTNPILWSNDIKHWPGDPLALQLILYASEHEARLYMSISRANRFSFFLGSLAIRAEDQQMKERIFTIQFQVRDPLLLNRLCSSESIPHFVPLAFLPSYRLASIGTDRSRH